MIWIIFVAVLVGMVFVSYLKKTNKGQHSSNETNTGSYSSSIQSSGYTSSTKPESPIPQNAKRVNFAVKGTMYRSAADINAARRVRVGDELTLIHEPHIYINVLFPKLPMTMCHLYTRMLFCRLTHVFQMMI